uniref:RdRp n=1 Tax=Beihai partiti-like virus 9 TaxID=1922511 RepID=A0A1L3KLH1_9VIRU|nr:RdRp [Beihai partiti-like virus 9]
MLAKLNYHPEVIRFRRIASRYRRSKTNKKAFLRWKEKYEKAVRNVEESKWNEERVKQGLDGLRKKLRKIRGLTPLALSSVKHTCFNDLSKSAGYNKGKAKIKADISLDECQEVLDRLVEGDLCHEYVSRVGFRSHIVEHDAPDKARVILVTAGPIVFVEKIFAYPFQLAMMNHSETVWGTGWTWDRHGGQILQHQFPNGAVSLDFKSFDLCAPNWLKAEIFSVIGESFELTEREQRLLDSISQLHQTGTATYGMYRIPLTHGVRTGSAFTHVIGTLLSIFLMEYCGVENYKCYGDDVIAEADLGYLRTVIFSTSYAIHPDKSCSGLHWLGLKLVQERWHIQDVDRRIASMMLPEPGKRKLDLATRMQGHILNGGRDPIVERWISILEETGNDAITPELREEVHRWGRTYNDCPFLTIREFHSYLTAEFA